MSNLTFNTWGIAAINHDTFNAHTIVTELPHPQQNAWSPSYRPQYETHVHHWPKASRDKVLTYARIYQLSLNVLGYMDFVPHLPAIAGSIRIAGGAILLGTALINGGDSNARGTFMAGNFLAEAVFTALAQVVRGFFEIYRPYGYNLNFYLDAAGSVVNLTSVGLYFIDYYTQSDRIVQSAPKSDQLIEGPNHHPILHLA